LDPRPRAPNPSLLQARAASALVKPTASQIGEWQLSIARLIGIGERGRTKETYDDKAAAEATELQRVVEESRRALHEQLRATPAEFAGHGRVRDCLQALDTVAIGAARAVFLLHLRSPDEFRPRN
jgi:hypothetical protein